MFNASLIVSPGPGSRQVRTADGQVLTAPANWILVPPGDPGLTRRIKADGPAWTVREIRHRKTFSRGVWSAAATVQRIQQELAAERAMPQYAKKQEAGARRREREQSAYIQTFEQSVRQYLGFHPRHARLAEALAHAVTAHATPVGSGTVARTERIPVEARAEAAVIAWMRHQTTAYDNLSIPRVKGKRREVRRALAAKSKALLDVYRTERAMDPAICPLQRAMAQHVNVPTDLRRLA